MTMTNALIARAMLVLGALALCPGCLFENEDRQRLDLGVSPSAGPLANSAAYRDTIGSYTVFDGMRAMRVRGYGIVVGLGKNGSSDCPRRVFDLLVQRLYKRHGFSNAELGTKFITPGALIRSLDSAVVTVEGNIPPAAVEGNRFDIVVRALPGTQTKSLRGGRLYRTDLEMFRNLSDRVSITGQALASAAGPVFVNPFSEGESATQTNALEGIVVYGGVTTKNRRVRLVLREPSYQRATQIQNRINSFFSGPNKVADAVSPSFVKLRVPEEFHNDSAHFLSLVRALYLSRDPTFQAAKARTLGAEMLSASAPHALIALAFEGLGRIALPELEKLYANTSDYAGFHAAAAGIRLGDYMSADALVEHAGDPACQYRFQAIRGLAEAKGMASASIALRNLLNDEDPRVQTAAYEGLVERGDSVIRSERLGRGNFTLDFISTQRDQFIYVKRSGARRIGLFGNDFLIDPPVFYRAPDGSVTLTAQEGDEKLTVLRVVVASGAMSPPVATPLELRSLIRLLGSEAAESATGEVTGMGLDYAAVARALYHLAKEGALNAAFILEQPNAAELFGPIRQEGRPESDL